MSRGHKAIEKVFAFVVVDPADNTEGIIGYASAIGWMPMIGADEGRVNFLRELAQETATEMGTAVTLCRFDRRVELEKIEPKPRKVPSSNGI